MICPPRFLSDLQLDKVPITRCHLVRKIVESNGILQENM